MKSHVRLLFSLSVWHSFLKRQGRDTFNSPIGPRILYHNNQFVYFPWRWLGLRVWRWLPVRDILQAAGGRLSQRQGETFRREATSEDYFGRTFLVHVIVLFYRQFWQNIHFLLGCAVQPRPEHLVPVRHRVHLAFQHSRQELLELEMI